MFPLHPVVCLCACSTDLLECSFVIWEGLHLFVLFDSVPVTFKSRFFSADIFWFISSSHVGRLICWYVWIFSPNLPVYVFPSTVLLLVVTILLFVLFFWFPIQVLYFCFFRRCLFYQWLVSLQHKLFRLFQWNCLLGYFLDNLFKFSVFTLTYFQSWFMKNVNVVFSVIILSINSKFFSLLVLRMMFWR